MNKEQLIEEMAGCKVCYQGWGKCPIENTLPGREYTNAENMYERGYRKVPDGAVILTPEERDEELKACNEKQAELETEIERLKADNEALQKNTAEAIGGIYNGHFSEQEKFAIYVMREIEKIFEPFIKKDDNNTENPQ